MIGDRIANLREHKKSIVLTIAFLLVAALTPQKSKAIEYGAVSPLERSGLTPVWWENFTDMNIANMQWTYALPPQEQINNFVIPGAVHLGQISTDGSSEHQINHYNYTDDEPFSHTVEFDMFQVWPGSSSRIFVRQHWSEYGVFIHLDYDIAGQPRTCVDFQNIKAVPSEHNFVCYNTYVGYGQWAHIVVSFDQDFAGDTIETVVAINNEIRQFTMDSMQLVELEPAWTNRREVWSFEFHGASTTSGIYVANFRAYQDFMNRLTLASILTPDAVDHYLATLPSPSTDRGVKWLLPRDSRYVDELEPQTPLAIISTNWVSDLTAQFDASASQAWRVITGIGWDFESDGVWDIVSENGVDERVVTVTYPASGIYSVTLGITRTYYNDSGGVIETSADTDTVTVTVGGTQGNVTLPVVNLAMPEDGAEYGVGSDITLLAEATDPDGIDRVEFYQGTSFLGQDTTSPYSITWDNVAGWNYAIYAKAFDARGASALSFPVFITVTDDADLSVTQTDSSDPVLAGRLLTFTLTVSNYGTLDASGVVLTDTLPDSVAFLSAIPSSVCVEADSVVVCDLDGLASGDSTQVTIQVGLDVSMTGTLINQAWVSANERDLNSDNNTTVEETTVLQEADLYLGQTDTPDPVVAGEQLTYTFTITNLGPSDASNVVLSDTLPGGATFLRVSPATDCSEAGETVTCQFERLAISTTAQILIAVQVGADVTGTIDNTGHATSDALDPQSNNNTATVETIVQSQADLALGQTDTPDPVVAGEQLTYTLALTNLGPSDATGVVLSDTLPGGATFLWVSPAEDCGADDGVVTCQFDRLRVYSSTQVMFQVEVGAAVSGTLANQARVMPTELDPNLDNNLATAETTVLIPPRLQISKSVEAAHDPARHGDAITYTVVVANSGDVDALDVHIVDVLPDHVSGTDLDTSATVGARAEVTFTISATLAPDAPHKAVITNTATYAHMSGSGQSSAVLTTTPDIVPPAFAEFHPATGSALITPTLGKTIFAPRPFFDWQDAIDNVAVVSYTLALTGGDAGQPYTLMVTTTQSVFSPTFDLALGAYTWTVRAHDAAGNASPFVAPAESFLVAAAPQVEMNEIYLPVVLKGR